MTNKLPETTDGLLTKEAIKDIILAISCSPETRRGDISIPDWAFAIIGAQHEVDLAHKAEAVDEAVKAERERVLEEVRKAVESTTRLPLIGCQPEDYNHPAFPAGAKSQMQAILEKLADMDEENYGIIKDKD